MKIVALKERLHNENRAAISPETAKLLTAKGFKVFVEKNIGGNCGFLDQDYTDSGATVSTVPLEIISDADIILKVQPSPLIDQINEISFAKEGAVIIGLLSPYFNRNYLLQAAEKKLTALAMELVPRVTRTQSMDVLSSQTNLAGYRAVIEASHLLNKVLPMMITSAGTITAAKVLVLGAGVAGLQAIATARRLGAIVAAYDVRSSTKEQVESLGGKFLRIGTETDFADRSGYARETSDEYKKKQEEFLTSIIKNYNIVITTAQIPGKKAPILVSKEMLESMAAGSVVLDMAANSGGNVEGSKLGEVITQNGVTISAPDNLAGCVAADSAKLYAKNLYNFINYIIKDGRFDFTDEIAEQMLLIKDGQIVNKELM